MKIEKAACLTLILSLISICYVRASYATASTHIWAPSTDTQGYGAGHITGDIYIPVENNADGTRPNAITNTGLTFGLLPLKYVNAEAGFDYKTGYGSLDSYPIYFNAKAAIPEDAFKGVLKYGEYIPSVAVGIYDVGTKTGKTDNDIVYVKAARTIKVKDFSLGRFSFGYFWGNDRILLDQDSAKDADGIFWAWERTIPEISDKLWVCTEYQGTKSAYGAFNLGLSWQFTKDVSVIAGYQFYSNKNLADTVTIQLDVNF